MNQTMLTIYVCSLAFGALIWMLNIHAPKSYVLRLYTAVLGLLSIVISVSILLASFIGVLL